MYNIVLIQQLILETYYITSSKILPNQILLCQKVSKITINIKTPKEIIYFLSIKIITLYIVLYISIL